MRSKIKLLFDNRNNSLFIVETDEKPLYKCQEDEKNNWRFG